MVPVLPDTTETQLIVAGALPDVAEDQMRALLDAGADDSLRAKGGTYKGNDDDTETVAVSALWVSNSDIDADTHYGVVKGLFDNKRAKKLLENGHAKGKSLTLESAFDGVPIPICPGAEKFYKEAGVK